MSKKENDLQLHEYIEPINLILHNKAHTQNLLPKSLRHMANTIQYNHETLIAYCNKSK